MSPSAFLPHLPFRNPFSSQPAKHDAAPPPAPDIIHAHDPAISAASLPSAPIPPAATLYDVTLPGTHDSAAYHARPELLSRAHLLPLRFGPVRSLVASVQTDFALTQNLSILGQLRAGARFLDIRVSKRPHSTADPRFWTVHGMVICVPLAHVIAQINAFHRETAPDPVTVVTVFRAQLLEDSEEDDLSRFVQGAFEHPFFAGDADDLRTTPLASLPPNVIAGIRGMPLPVAWGQDPWLDTYSSQKKIAFLNRTLDFAQPCHMRNDLLVIGWTVTPHTTDVTLRVLSLGFCRPGVKTEAVKMNSRFAPFFKEHRDILQQRANVIFFDCFTSKHAALVNALNSTMSDTEAEDSAIS